MERRKRSNWIKHMYNPNYGKRTGKLIPSRKNLDELFPSSPSDFSSSASDSSTVLLSVPKKRTQRLARAIPSFENTSSDNTPISSQTPKGLLPIETIQKLATDGTKNGSFTEVLNSSSDCQLNSASKNVKLSNIERRLRFSEIHLVPLSEHPSALPTPEKSSSENLSRLSKRDSNEEMSASTPSKLRKISSERRTSPRRRQVSTPQKSVSRRSHLTNKETTVSEASPPTMSQSSHSMLQKREISPERRTSPRRRQVSTPQKSVSRRSHLTNKETTVSETSSPTMSQSSHSMLQKRKISPERRTSPRRRQVSTPQKSVSRRSHLTNKETTVSEASSPTMFQSCHSMLQKRNNNAVAEESSTPKRKKPTKKSTHTFLSKLNETDRTSSSAEKYVLSSPKSSVRLNEIITGQGKHNANHADDDSDSSLEDCPDEFVIQTDMVKISPKSKVATQLSNSSNRSKAPQLPRNSVIVVGSEQQSIRTQHDSPRNSLHSRSSQKKDEANLKEWLNTKETQKHAEKQTKTTTTSKQKSATKRKPKGSGDVKLNVNAASNSDNLNNAVSSLPLVDQSSIINLYDSYSKTTRTRMGPPASTPRQVGKSKIDPSIPEKNAAETASELTISSHSEESSLGDYGETSPAYIALSRDISHDDANKTNEKENEHTLVAEDYAQILSKTKSPGKTPVKEKKYKSRQKRKSNKKAKFNKKKNLPDTKIDPLVRSKRKKSTRKMKTAKEKRTDNVKEEKTAAHSSRKKRNISQRVPVYGELYIQSPPKLTIRKPSPTAVELGLRRSKRARVRPLQTWYGERLEYDHNNELIGITTRQSSFEPVHFSDDSSSTDLPKKTRRKNKVLPKSSKDQFAKNSSSEDQPKHYKSARKKINHASLLIPTEVNLNGDRDLQHSEEEIVETTLKHFDNTDISSMPHARKSTSMTQMSEIGQSISSSSSNLRRGARKRKGIKEKFVSTRSENNRSIASSINDNEVAAVGNISDVSKMTAEERNSTSYSIIGDNGRTCLIAAKNLVSLPESDEPFGITGKRWQEGDPVRLTKCLSNKGAAIGTVGLEVGEEKGLSIMESHHLSYYVVYGVVEVTIGTNVVVVSSGSCFFVPPKNQYNIRNVSTDQSALLVFNQNKYWRIGVYA